MAVYFDNAATTAVRGEAAAKVLYAMEHCYGNPSSTHLLGRNAAGLVTEARENIASALGAAVGEVFFTSGGTEADNWAVKGSVKLQTRLGGHIITSAAEHDAVLAPVRELENSGKTVTYLEPDSNGIIPPDALERALRDDTVLVSLMLVNNETGAVNPVADYADVLRRRGSRAVLHTDAVQAFCKIPFTAKSLGADLISMSAHKIHGAKGTGALYISKTGKAAKLPPLLLGGGQENGLRSGTEAVPAISGFGEAARLAKEELAETSANTQKLREYIKSELKNAVPRTVFIPGGSPFILSISLPGYKSEVLINFLEGSGIYASKSAACKKGRRSRVLEAMRLDNRVIDGAIRLSFSRYNTLKDADLLIKALLEASRTLIHT